MSDLTKLSPSHICNIEAGSSLSVESLVAVCKALNVSIDWAVGE